MRNCNISFISCLHSALTARLSHLLIHCNEKLHFSRFWNGSSDLYRFLFQELCYVIRLWMRSINHLSYCIQTGGPTRPSTISSAGHRQYRCFIEWETIPVMLKMKLGVKFMPY